MLLLLLLLLLRGPRVEGSGPTDRRRAVNRANRAIYIFFILPNRGVLPA